LNYKKSFGAWRPSWFSRNAQG